MYVKAHCPVCGSDLYHNIRLNILEQRSFEGEKQAYRYAVENFPKRVRRPPPACLAALTK